MENKEESNDLTLDFEKANEDGNSGLSWTSAIVSIVLILVVGLLIAMCGGWMPWQV